MHKGRIKISGGGDKRNHQFVSFASKFGGNCNLLEQSKIKAFTLAEMLITLVIIGVVAALTIPTVLKNYNDKKYNTARLKALKTFGEAGKMASINDEINGQPTARAFVESVLSKYLKITKVCDNDKASECNFPSQVQPSDTTKSKLNPNSYKTWKNIGPNNTENNRTPVEDTNLSVYITTVDGFSAKIFYNPKCIKESKENPHANVCYSKECYVQMVDAACMNVIYDMNGVKAPNHIGEDIGFVTVFWSGLKTMAAAPGILPYNKAQNIFNKKERGMNYIEAVDACRLEGTEKVPLYLPSVYELSSIYINKNFSSIPYSYYWSGSYVSGEAGKAWLAYDYCSLATYNMQNSNGSVWCVRR